MMPALGGFSGDGAVLLDSDLRIQGRSLAATPDSGRPLGWGQVEGKMSSGTSWNLF